MPLRRRFRHEFPTQRNSEVFWRNTESLHENREFYRPEFISSPAKIFAKEDYSVTSAVTPIAHQMLQCRECPLSADFVEKVRAQIGVDRAGGLTTQWISEAIGCQAGFRFGTGISFASFRRFWAVAARRNSSCAPFGPRSRRRPRLRMRLRCANSISTFLRSRR